MVFMGCLFSPMNCWRVSHAKLPPSCKCIWYPLMAHWFRLACGTHLVLDSILGLQSVLQSDFVDTADVSFLALGYPQKLICMYKAKREKKLHQNYQKFWKTKHPKQSLFQVFESLILSQSLEQSFTCSHLFDYSIGGTIRLLMNNLHPTKDQP